MLTIFSRKEWAAVIAGMCAVAAIGFGLTQLGRAAVGVVIDVFY